MKTTEIHLRCTPEQKEKIKKQAERLGLSLSQYLLMSALSRNADKQSYMGKVVEMEYKIGAVYDFKLFGFATGEYQCLCSICNRTFFGDKRSSMCLGCAIKRAESLAKQPHPAHDIDYTKCPNCGSDDYTPDNYRCEYCKTQRTMHFG